MFKGIRALILGEIEYVIVMGAYSTEQYVTM